MTRRTAMSTRSKHRPLTWLTLAMPLLFACGQNANVPVNPDPYAGGVSYPWSYTPPEGQLSAQSLTPDINTLSYEPLLAARNAWGPIELDHSNGERLAGDGKTLTLDGKTYARGFGVHAGSEMRFSLKGTNGATCKRFLSDIGVDDEVGNRGSVVFQVYLDGVKAYDSGKVTGASATKKVDLDIAGKEELRLVVTDSGDGVAYDHADWASPQVDCRAVQTSGELDLGFGVNGILQTNGIDVVQEPSGALLILEQGVDENFHLKRRLSSGQVMQVSTDIGGEDAPYFLRRQSDGKIVVAGETRITDSFGYSKLSFALVRYNTDLSLDTGFGIGGKVTTLIRAGSSINITSNIINAMASTPDGKVIVAGVVERLNSNNEINEPAYTNIFIRYKSDGKLDASFGQAGILTLDGRSYDNLNSNLAFDNIRTIAVQADGKTIVGINSFRSGAGQFFRIIRLNVNGSFDTSFGSLRNGIFSTNLEYTVFAQDNALTSVALTEDDEILIGAFISSFNIMPILIRLSPDGNINGVLRINELAQSLGYSGVSEVTGSVRGLKTMKDGSILVSTRFGEENGVDAKYTNVLTRLKSDFSLDMTFGKSGRSDASTSGNFIQYSDDEILIYDRYKRVSRYLP